MEYISLQLMNIAIAASTCTNSKRQTLIPMTEPGMF